jgi:tyrosyl-tRNA synthetase
MRSVFEELDARGFISQLSDDALRDHLRHPPVTMYVGFDPTADSLHVGHLLPIMAMTHLQRFGHRVLVVVGGATGMIGDPSGKNEERSLLGPEDVARNTAAVKRQLDRFLDFQGANAARILDNNDWIGPIPFVSWLRDVGKFFNVNYMLAKESVKRRMNAEQGISYTEFSYMTMQAYDFVHLHDAYGCTLQAGGNDQWGNITAGIDLIHRLRRARAFGLTFPLIETATGEKLGKTAGNAIWLDTNRTSPYQFYQYWIRLPDADVERFLKLFTFLPLEEIGSTCDLHRRDPGKRIGQRRLAQEITRVVHGDAALARAEHASEVLFGGEVAGLSDAELCVIFADVPSKGFPRARLEAGVAIVDLLVEARLVTSKGDGRRKIQQGGIYINNHRVNEPEAALGIGNLASESMLVVRVGKKQYALLRFV